MVDIWMNFDTAKIADAMGVNEDEVLNMMKDGRYAAPWMEHRIRHEFGFYKPEDDEDAMSEYGPVEFKGITKGGVKIVPSWMVGSGRSMDWDRLNEWIEGMTGGFILHDNTQFPSVPCWLIENMVVQGWVSNGLFSSSGNLSYNKIIELLE